MRAYVTSIGERTTQICCDQLKRRGFDVELLDSIKPWYEKYTEFIFKAKSYGKDCVRVDADVIVNRHFTPLNVVEDSELMHNMLMLQYRIFDFYKNDIGAGQPVFYSAAAVQIISQSTECLDRARPETSAWRLPQINKMTRTVDTVVGMHGFYQDEPTIGRAWRNKMERKQMGSFDFELVSQITNLK